MPISPDLADDLAQPVVRVYSEAERVILGRIRALVATGVLAPLMLPLQQAVASEMAAAETVAYATLVRALQTAWGRGVQLADADLAKLVGPDAQLVQAIQPTLAPIVTEATGALAKARYAIFRSVPDAYRNVVQIASARILIGAQTRRQATQHALNELATRGITGFVDQRGRRWQLDAYVEMATRTATGRAAVEGHTSRLTQNGWNLVVVSDVPQECAVCRPYEGKVLSLDGDGVVDGPAIATLDQARSAGFMHPNAVLGDVAAQSLGQVQNAARVWYSGPSVNLTTARGYHLAVSPNHPVLTAIGWLPADLISEGLQVFSGAVSQRVTGTAVSNVELYDPPSTFQQIHDALAATGSRTSAPAAADDFHGDGRSYQGNVDVVWASSFLRNDFEAVSFKQIDHGLFVGTSADTVPLAGRCPRHATAQGVRASVAWTLPNTDPGGAKAAPDGRIADIEQGRYLLARLAGCVEPDEVVHVERNWYTGHAYDLQTESGAYLAGSIVAHNCRHSVAGYQPEITRLPQGTADPAGDAARQRLRYLERQVRAARRREAVALDDQARTEARAQIRAGQARIRDHVAATTAKRQPRRERLQG